MAVGIKVGFYWYQVGNGEFLHAFFSNICYHLEDGNWGSKFPTLMNQLYNGKLESSNADEAYAELKVIKDSLDKISPMQVIWDIDDISKKTPWGDNISSDITSLGNYFITSEGADLITHFFNALQKSIDYSIDIQIKSI